MDTGQTGGDTLRLHRMKMSFNETQSLVNIVLLLLGGLHQKEPYPTAKMDHRSHKILHANNYIPRSLLRCHFIAKATMNNHDDEEKGKWIFTPGGQVLLRGGSGAAVTEWKLTCHFYQSISSYIAFLTSPVATTFE